MVDDILKTSLLDLWNAIGPATERILLGGGYGLYLKQVHLTQTGSDTLIPIAVWPVPRGTEDLDLLLSVEIVSSVEDMKAVRDALDRLDYEVVKGSEYLHFARQISDTQIVKIDLLTAQLDTFDNNPTIKADKRRVRPKSKDRPEIHAHPTDGAIGLTDSTSMLDVSGTLTTGTPTTARVRLPHPCSYLLMKLTAYRDRKQDPQKEFAQHHALDIFRVVAMLTRSDLGEVVTRVGQYHDNPQVQSCRQIVATDFSNDTAPGVRAMRRHELWRNDDQLQIFTGVMQEIF